MEAVPAGDKKGLWDNGDMYVMWSHISKDLNEGREQAKKIPG